MTTTTVDVDPRIQERLEVVADERRGRRLARWSIVVIILALCAVAYLLSRTEVLDVDEVVVLGARNTSVEQIREAAGFAVGQPLVDVDLAGAQDALAALPYVKSVALEQSLEGVIRIEVVERHPAAMLATADALILVDEEGRILEVKDARAIGLHRDLVAIRGLEIEPVPGHWVDDDTLDLIGAARALPAEIAGATYGLEMTPDGLDLYLGSKTGRVILGDTREMEAKIWAIRALAAGADMQCLEAADLRAPSVPVLTFRPNCP